MNEPETHKLYKFQPVDKFSIINLINHQFYFSTPTEFNDPYDCDPPIKIIQAHRTKKNVKSLYEKIRKYESNDIFFKNKYLTNGDPNKRFELEFIDSPNRRKKQIHNQIGVTCFSESVDNILLWSIYADKHKGFCLEFDTRIPIMDKVNLKHLHKVNYRKTDSYRKYSILDLLKNDTVFFEELLTTKSYYWRFEKEWRIFCNDGGEKTHYYNPKSLTGIYFGYKMPQEYKLVLINILTSYPEQDNTSDQLNISNNNAIPKIGKTNIIRYSMMLDHEKFKVTPILRRSI